MPCKTRTETVLRRTGFYGRPSRFDTLTEAEVLGWWNAGRVTVADLRLAANRTVRHHHDETDQRSQTNVALVGVAVEPWAERVWRRDPRFSICLPKGDGTVAAIAASGRPADRRALWARLGDSRAAVTAQAARSLRDAVTEYVEDISGQHGIRLEALLARTGLNGRDPIHGTIAARMIGVTPARLYQIGDQLERCRTKARSPAGVWIPQFGAAEIADWPDESAAAGVEATRAFSTAS